MSDHALLEARAKVLAQARAALDALVIWELTHATDLRRYHRAGIAIDMARDLEKAYATRVSDVDMGIDTPLGRGVMNGMVRMRNVHMDRDPMGDYIRQGMFNNAVDQANMANVELAPVAPDLAPLAQTAEALLRDGNRALDQLPPREADRVIDRLNADNLGDPNDVPAHVRDAVAAANRIDPRGAPFGTPPPIAMAGLPESLRPVFDMWQEAMEGFRPDHVTRVAQRVDALGSAIRTAKDLGRDTSILERELEDTLADLEQEHVPPAPGEVT